MAAFGEGFEGDCVGYSYYYVPEEITFKVSIFHTYLYLASPDNFFFSGRVRISR